MTSCYGAKWRYYLSTYYKRCFFYILKENRQSKMQSAFLTFNKMFVYTKLTFNNNLYNSIHVEIMPKKIDQNIFKLKAAIEI